MSSSNPFEQVEIAPGVWTNARHARTIAGQDRMNAVDSLAANIRNNSISTAEADELRIARADGDEGLMRYLERRGLDGQDELTLLKANMGGLSGLFARIFGL